MWVVIMLLWWLILLMLNDHSKVTLFWTPEYTDIVEICTTGKLARAGRTGICNFQHIIGPITFDCLSQTKHYPFHLYGEPVSKDSTKRVSIRVQLSIVSLLSMRKESALLLWFLSRVVIHTKLSALHLLVSATASKRRRFLNFYFLKSLTDLFSTLRLESLF